MEFVRIIFGLLFRGVYQGIKDGDGDGWDDIKGWQVIVGLIFDMVVIYSVYKLYNRKIVRPEDEILLKKDGTPRKKLSEVNDEDDLQEWLQDNYCEPEKGWPAGVTYDELDAMRKRLHRSRKGKPEWGGRYDDVDDE